MTRRRLDREMVRRGLAATRSEARDAILTGRVRTEAAATPKPGTMVGPDESIDMLRPSRPYASRAGEKLAGALDRFEVDPLGKTCLDAGASTGGFTDVLVRRGADRVMAVDVGYGQIAWSLRNDPRVEVMDRVNVRELGPEDMQGPVDLVVADLSFISLASVVPALAAVAGDSAEALLLVKPQFESSRSDVRSGGVVRDPDVWSEAIERVVAACDAEGFHPQGVMASPLLGPAGNVEFFVHASRNRGARALDLHPAISEGLSLVERRRRAREAM